MNARSTPTRTHLRHCANQRPDVRGYRRSSDAAPALPGTPEPEAPSAPGEDGLRLDDDERRSPPGPEPREHDPEAAVARREPQPLWSSALQHLQLAPQR